MRNVTNSILSSSKAALILTLLLLSSFIISIAYGHPVDENKSRDQL